MTTNLVGMLQALDKASSFQEMTVQQLLNYITHAAALKHEISQSQPANSTLAIPKVLPPSITEFLSESIPLLTHVVDSYWPVLKETVWTLPSQNEF